MKIYTSYFGNIRNLPNDMVWISIARYVKGWIGNVAPGFNAFYPSVGLLRWIKSKGYKITSEDLETYTKLYKEETLSLLDQHKVFKQLEHWSEGKDIVLLCYERPEKFCHRHIVAEWFKEGGYEVEELGTYKK